jgi:hypothetical protein
LDAQHPQRSGRSASGKPSSIRFKCLYIACRIHYDKYGESHYDFQTGRRGGQTLAVSLFLFHSLYAVSPVIVGKFHPHYRQLYPLHTVTVHKKSQPIFRHGK